MPKLDLNKAFATQNTEDRKKIANSATTLLTAGGTDFNNDKSLLDVKSIKLDRIVEREINDFAQDNIDSLAHSIEQYGLINPISVVHDELKDTYTISSGHRRYKAMCQLHQEYPDYKDYENIDCAVYELTSDKFKLKQGIPYISKEQEQGIYRDSNLESRQLSYSDVAHQIRHLVEKFDDPIYIQKLRENALKNGVKTRNADFDKAKLIINVLSTQKYSGWKRESIRMYVKIYENHREDLMDAIESGEMKVSAAYKSMIEEQNLSRKRKTNKIIELSRAVESIKKESESREYSKEEKTQIREIVETLLGLIEN